MNQDMNKEAAYQDRKDTVLRFPPPPQQQQHQQGGHGHHGHGQQQQRQQHQQGGHGHHGHGQQQQQQLECFSDEVDSRGSAEERKAKGAAVAAGGDGASIEVAKRRRGRPPGSKNKPKPPVVVTRDADPAAAMRPHVLEIPGGGDVADALARFARRRNLGICVLAGTGAVANVSLRHPAPGGAGAFVFRGRYEILSISATILPPSMSAVAPQAAAAAAGLSISLAGPHGQIVGGAVAGPLFAATTVVVVAAAFTNPTFHRLPADDDASVSISVSVSGSGEAEDAGDPRRRGPHPQHGEPEQHHPPPSQPPHAAAVTRPPESGGASIYGRHPPPSEIIWAPPARAQHPPY